MLYGTMISQHLINMQPPLPLVHKHAPSQPVFHSLRTRLAHFNYATAQRREAQPEWELVELVFCLLGFGS